MNYIRDILCMTPRGLWCVTVLSFLFLPLFNYTLDSLILCVTIFCDVKHCDLNAE